MMKLKRKKKKQNQGNSFIMVVATLSFLAILVAAILVAVALCYRLKAYDINARDNFYYLEQAMDEIYAGVGADAMTHLNTAYDDTIEVLVYFDVTTQSYVTMDDEQANKILKNTYISLVKNDPNYADRATVTNHLNSFLSNAYDSTGNPEGVQLSIANKADDEDSVTIVDLVLKREAKYSTVNTRKAADGTVAAGETFVQTITTDLVIGKPEFNVNFNTIAAELNDLYGFAFVADKGIEIGNATSTVNITGNIYAASDFYNKDYNVTDSSDPNYIDKTSEANAVKYAAVSSYKSGEDRYKNCDGKQQKSMYSGFYIDGANVIIAAERIIVPGTIAAFNSANLTISGANQSTLSPAEIWADGIVLGGYSLLKNANTKAVQGATVNLRANAYIADDLELNAKASSFFMIGQYYGYNYASLDNRTFADSAITPDRVRSFTSNVPDTIKDGATIEGQAHYNSSAIIVNGENSSLDLSSVSAMYIAGQAYIETSKEYKDDKTTETVINKENQEEVVEYNEFDYPEQSTRTVKDDKGKDQDVPDNYTTNSANAGDAKKNTNIQDYRTGEAISIKSNQLAYIPNWAVTDNETGLYLNLPNGLRNLDIFKNNWKDLGKIPIIKTVISGKTYYFFDFSTDATTQAGLDTDVMNGFIAAYADMFTVEEGEDQSKGEVYGLTDITDYNYFQIEMLKVNTSYEDDGTPLVNSNTGNIDTIYSNSAISIKNGTTVTIKAKSSSIDPLIRAAENINANIAEQNKFVEEGGTKNGDSIDLSAASNQVAATLANSVTTRLQSQYKEVKWTLTSKSRNQVGVQDAHSMAESDITPINYFFYFNQIGGTGWRDIVAKLSSGYKVWVKEDDVTVEAGSDFPNGDVKGLIICKGDVTFASDVKSFEGLIVSGSKVKIERSMNIMANEEIIKTILRECDESQANSDSSKNYFAVCELFQQYQSIYKPETGTGTIQTESTKSISAVQFEDVLSFRNWKKNVD